MFDKIKAIDRARRLQGEVKKIQESVYQEVEQQGYKILVRGDKHLEKLEIDGVENKVLRNLINDAFKDVDKKVEKKAKGYASELGLDL